MFRCDHCLKTSEPGVPMRRIVVETRHRIYTEQSGAVIGRGHEIVKEVGVCQDCSRLPTFATMALA